MEKSKTIGNVLSLIKKQSLKHEINSDNKYMILFKSIATTNYSYINGLPYVIIKCNLKFLKSKFSNNVPFLTDIQFPLIFHDMYKQVCEKYFENKNYLEFTDNTFGNKKEGLVMFPKIKCQNDDLIYSGSGSYKLTLQFGSILNKSEVFKINFYIKDFKKISNECSTDIIDEFKFEEDNEYLPDN
jgi:hypothetical protein